MLKERTKEKLSAGLHNDFVFPLIHGREKLQFFPACRDQNRTKPSLHPIAEPLAPKGQKGGARREIYFLAFWLLYITSFAPRPFMQA